VVVPLQYDQIENYAEGLAAFRAGKKWGFLDRQGNVVIPPEYDRAWSFSEGVATAVRKRTQVVIDTRGAVVFEREGASSIGPCREGVMACETRRRWSFLDRAGQTKFELTCSAAGSFFDSRATALVKGRIGYVDPTGTMVIAPTFAQAGDFSDASPPSK
jgi:hypothetical protein